MLFLSMLYTITNNYRTYLNLNSTPHRKNRLANSDERNKQCNYQMNQNIANIKLSMVDNHDLNHNTLMNNNSLEDYSECLNKLNKSNQLDYK